MKILLIRFDTCNIWDGEVRMGVIEERRQMINKIRWERWERSKIRSFYARGEWNQWGNWSDVPSEKCGCDECPKVVRSKRSRRRFQLYDVSYI